MSMNKSEWFDLISAAFEAGRMDKQAELEPASDRMSQREAWRCFGRQWVTELVKAGKVVPQRNSTKANCTLVYSRAELSRLKANERIYKDIVIITHKSN